MAETVVESFTLDHTKVKAPYVRVIESQNGPQGGPNCVGVITVKF